MNWQLRKGTANRKLGRGAWVVTLDRKTCPSSCPLKGAGCYAEGGPLRLTWDRVSRGEAKDDGRTAWAGTGFRDLSRTLLREVPSGALLRIGDAGDPSYRGKLSRELLRALGRLSRERGVRVILYTHSGDVEGALYGREHGVTVNLSTHGDLPGIPGLSMVDRVTTMPRSASWDVRGWNLDRTVLRCPAETRDEVTCESCGLCARSRGYAIGFTAHGASAAKVEAVS